MGFFSKRMDKKLAVYQQELIQTHYQEVDNMYRQIRGWRHDYRNHIQTMKAYAAAEDWEDVYKRQVLKLPVLWVYFLLCTDEFVKWPWVFRHYRKGTWAKNITRDDLFE